MVQSVCEQILSRSLADHGLEQIPETGETVGRWIEQSLRPLILATVGPDAADLLLRELAPMAAYVASQPVKPVLTMPPAMPLGATASPLDTQSHDTTRAREPARSKGTKRDDITQRIYTLPAPPMASLLSRSAEEEEETARIVITSSPQPSAALAKSAEKNGSQKGTHPQNLQNLREQLRALPRVFAASQSNSLPSALQTYLAGTATVVQVTDLVSLLDALDESGAGPQLLLMDCKDPSIHVGSVAAMRDELPVGTTVLVWGVDEVTWRTLAPENSQTNRWVRCSQEATTDDVGSLCSMLLG